MNVGTFAQVGPDVHVAAVCLHETFGDGQTESRAARADLLGFVCSEEFVKDVGQRVGVDSDPGILHGSDHKALIAVPLDTDVNPPGGWCILDRVTNQIRPDGLQVIFVCADWGEFRRNVDIDRLFLFLCLSTKQREKPPP